MVRPSAVNPSSAARNGHPTASATSSDFSDPVTFRRQADSDSESEKYSMSTVAKSTSIKAPPNDPSLLPNGTRSLSFIATQAFGLGFLLALCLSGIATAILQKSTLWRLPAFFATLSIFHFLEFWTTARYNLANARASSFLLWNNPEYNYAHALATVEILLLHFLVPRFQTFGAIGSAISVLLGTSLIVLGQTARSAAMITAGTNFNHIPARAHAAGHELVTTGIYSHLRHPSYFGFFWWAIGTQVLVGNKICLVGYALVLWRFFSKRIVAEERSLVSFFGDDYEAYRRRVRTLIPFIQ